MSTYQPTMRECGTDWIRKMLFSDDREGQGKAEKVSNLFEMSPYGLATGMNDAGRAVGEGNYGDAAMLLGMAGMPGPTPKGTRGGVDKELAAGWSSLYNPPAKQERLFSEDYRDGAPADQSGKLTHSIDGDPLTADWIAGRNMVGQDSRPVGYDGFVDIGTHLTRDGVSKVAPSSIRGRSGTAVFDGVDGAPLRVTLCNKLDETGTGRVLGHEVGHVIDQLAGEIPVSGHAEALASLYNTLNTRRERTTKLMGPKHLGYKSEEAPREGSPAYAEMDPWRSPNSRGRSRLPRLRGDGPSQPSCLSSGCVAPPA